MNTHTVGGNSELTRYVGMDEYGNKYYECFDAERNHFFIFKTTISEDGLSTTIIFRLEVRTVTEYLRNGMDGSITCTTTIHYPIVTLSTIRFLKSHTNGSLRLQLSECTYQRQHQSTRSFCNTEKAGKTSSQQSGLQ